MLRATLLLIFLIAVYLGIYIYCKCSFVTSRCEQDYNVFSYLNTLSESGPFLRLRLLSREKIRTYLPSPHSELLLGLVLGINDLKLVPVFNDVAVATGTIHVLVVSGYNVNLLYSLIARLLTSNKNQLSVILSVTFLLLYAMLTGLQPPVLRALVMTVLNALFSDLSSGIILLLYSAIFMLLGRPSYIYNMSFQLSFLAALGLVIYSPIFEHRLGKFGSSDLTATFAAQVYVWPLISYSFGRISLISFLANAALLWLIPISTILGLIFLCLLFINEYLAAIFSYVVIVPLDIFVHFAGVFSKVPYAQVPFEISFWLLSLYYIVVLVLPVLWKYKNS